MTAVLVLHGPNLGALGTRQPEIYGSMTLDDLVGQIKGWAAEAGIDVDHKQSDREGVLVEWVHEARGRYDAMIINPGALTHYGWSLADALAVFEGPIIEVHLSHIDSREPWRRTSVVSPVASGVISGFGADGYRLAISALAQQLGD